MTQKYKVYYNNKVIFITDRINEGGITSEYRLCHYPEADLKKEWNAFCADKQVKFFYITGEPDAAWKAFNKLFIIIKAAGGLVKNAQGEYLFIFRNKKWDLPKGKMDKGEEWEETALREVEEECGVKELKIAAPIGKSYHIYELQGRLALKQTYWFHMDCADTGELVPQQEEGIEKAVWVKPEVFKKWKNEMYPSVWDIVKGVE